MFWAGWELQGAVDLHWNDSSLGAYSVFDGIQIDCTPTSVSASGGPALNATTPYGQALFTDLPTGRRQLIPSRAACNAALRRFIPGPAVLPWG